MLLQVGMQVPKQVGHMVLAGVRMQAGGRVQAEVPAQVRMLDWMWRPEHLSSCPLHPIPLCHKMRCVWCLWAALLLLSQLPRAALQTQ